MTASFLGNDNPVSNESPNAASGMRLGAACAVLAAATFL